MPAMPGIEAVEITRRLRPDVVLMDIQMPNQVRPEATKQIVESGLGSGVLILTTFDFDEYVYGRSQKAPPESC